MYNNLHLQKLYEGKEYEEKKTAEEDSTLENVWNRPSKYEDNIKQSKVRIIISLKLRQKSACWMRKKKA